MLVRPWLFSVIEYWWRGGHSSLLNAGATVAILVIESGRGRGSSLLLNAGAAAAIVCY
jgi:hypothetical protein